MIIHNYSDAPAVKSVQNLPHRRQLKPQRTRNPSRSCKSRPGGLYNFLIKQFDRSLIRLLDQEDTFITEVVVVRVCWNLPRSIHRGQPLNLFTHSRQSRGGAGDPGGVASALFEIPLFFIYVSSFRRAAH